jgi:hypothetical protein
MAYVGPRKQGFSLVSLFGDLLKQTGDVVEELAWYPRILGRHLDAHNKHKAARAKFAERAALELEALTKEPTDATRRIP